MAEHADKSEQSEQLRQDENATDATRALPTAPAAPAAPAAEPAARTTPPPSGRRDEQQEGRRRAKPNVDWQVAKDQIVELLAGVARWLGLIFAVILVLHVVFVIGEANPDNGIAEFVRSWSDGLSLGFQDLFTPDDAKLRTLVNYGIAALFWLVISAVVAKIIRRIGGGTTS